MRKLAKVVLFVVYSAAASLFLLEAATRIWGYSERYIYDPIYMPFEASDEIPYVHKPNLVDARARGLSIIHTDSLGLRSLSPGTEYGPKAPDEFRIAVMGDSITFGEGVLDTADVYPEVLGRILNDEQDAVRVRVFDFGVSAYSVREMAATLEHRVLSLDPDLVLMAIIPHNFVLSRTGRVDRFGYTANNQLSGVVDKDSVLKRWLRDVHLVYLVRDARYGLLRRGRGGDEVSSQSSPAAALPDSYDYVRRFRAVAESADLAYAVVLLPIPRQPFDAIRAQLRDEGTTFVDLSGLEHEFTPEEYRASPFDGHPSRRVHRRLGEELAAYVLREYLEPRAE